MDSESVLPARGNIKPLVVMPAKAAAKAGIHSHGPVFMGSGFRRNDNERKNGGSSLRELLAVAMSPPVVTVGF